jgi:hypothetical protein
MEKMLQSMMKQYKWFIVMGAMIVMLALVIGAWNASNAANYYAVDKATRDISAELAQDRAVIESTIVWLPYFKFLGVAMILAGIVMAVGLIGLKLQTLGKEVMSSVPQSARLPIPPRPKSVMVMRMFMMLGMLIIMVGFIFSLFTAATAYDVFGHTVKEIDSAQTASTLLNDLATVHSNEAWLEALKFVGVAFFFVSIVSGLHTIVFALQYQQKAIPQVVQKNKAVDSLELNQSFAPAPSSGD